MSLPFCNFEGYFPSCLGAVFQEAEKQYDGRHQGTWTVREDIFITTSDCWQIGYLFAKQLLRYGRDKILGVFTEDIKNAAQYVKNHFNDKPSTYHSGLPGTSKYISELLRKRDYQNFINRGPSLMINAEGRDVMMNKYEIIALGHLLLVGFYQVFMPKEIDLLYTREIALAADFVLKEV